MFRQLRDQYGRDRDGDGRLFLRSLVRSPKAVGSIAPTGRRLAEEMAKAVRPQSGLPVLELGPGMGAITRAILASGLPPHQLVAIERDPAFVRKLRRDFPGVRFVEGDAFDLERALEGTGAGEFDAVVSGLPLLNFSKARRLRLLEALLDRLPPGRPVVQFSYGAVSPFPRNGAGHETGSGNWILGNLPPARVWTYRGRDGGNRVGRPGRAPAKVRAGPASAAPPA